MTKPLTREQVAELRAELEHAGVNALWDDDVRALLATVEAQAEVIERLTDGWLPTEAGGWYHPSTSPSQARAEPASEAHQLVLYGEVVAPRGESDE